MGSKRWMLSNGLGQLIHQELQKANRFVDLFSGSGAVAKYAATTSNRRVLAYDLQEFSVVLANSVIARSASLSVQPLWESWLSRANSWIQEHKLTTLGKTRLPNLTHGFNAKYVKEIRLISGEQLTPVLKSYGGYYYSIQQALWLDALRATLPDTDTERSVCLAALIHAASQCAASPGHTAQPFSCSRTSKRYLHQAWSQSIRDRCKAALDVINGEFAQVIGSACVQDAAVAAQSLTEGDLVFVDPPYSGVHYSRFYHVLETIARGHCGPVSGSGRYPPPNERPRSTFSIASESHQALDALLKTLASQGAKAILTFPQRKCSNGLSGGQVSDIASQYFKVYHKIRWAHSREVLFAAPVASRKRPRNS